MIVQNILEKPKSLKFRNYSKYPYQTTVHCHFEGRANMHIKIHPNWLIGINAVSLWIKRSMQITKNFFTAAFIYLIRAKYVFFQIYFKPSFVLCGWNQFRCSLSKRMVQNQITLSRITIVPGPKPISTGADCKAGFPYEIILLKRI